jgi:membrane protease subunit (stomatin/prohibitin family)
MGLWDTVKQHASAQFLDVIEWLDDTRNTIVYRFPTFQRAIQDGGKLVVREGQAAVFVAEGRFSECFNAGTYELSTRTKPILSFFESIKYQLDYPYKGDIYFVNIRNFTDQKWGTPQPIPVRDPEFGSIQIRAFGIFSYKVTDPPKFLREVVGTDGLFTTDEINGQLKRKVLSVFANLLKLSQIPFDMLVGSALELSDALKEKLSPKFQEDYGITVTDFTVDGVTLPDDVQKFYAKRQGMAMVGNLDSFAKFEAANAIGDAARNPGLGGAGIGMGVGFGLGQQVGNVMANAAAAPANFDPHQGLQSTPPPPPGPAGPAKFHYNGAAGQGQYTASEIAAFVVANRAGPHNVWSAGWPAWKPWNEVPEVASALPPEPPPAPAAATLFYLGEDGKQVEVAVAEVARLVAANPSGNHLVWKAGMDGWKSARELPEVAALLGGPPQPPPPPGPR